MKKVLLLTLVMVFGASLAFGQAGVIGTYGDPAGLDCNVVDAAAGLLIINVVHTLSPGATASQFQAATPACMVGATYLADQQVFPVTVGNTQTGVAIGYGGCLGSPVHVIGIQYFASGLSMACCAFPVTPDPAVPSGQIEVVDCASTLIFATGAANTVNGNPTCDCAVPTEESSWGKVKALYQ